MISGHRQDLALGLGSGGYEDEVDRRRIEFSQSGKENFRVKGGP